MKKSTKGALAAGAAGALLLGGAGSLAYWTATGSVQGGNISSGTLGIGTPDCEPGAGTGSVWKLDGGGAFDPATDTIVPGDVLTKVCTYTIAANGKHLVADLAATGGEMDASSNATALDAALVPVGTFVVSGNTVNQITSADNNKTLKATVTVTFPEGDSAVDAADNTTQSLASTLSNFVVTATQSHN